MSTKQIKLEQAMDRLSEIVSILEKGETDLDTSLKLYEEGVQLVKQCSERLDRAEQRVRLLRVGTDGEVHEEMFSTDVKGTEVE